MIRYPQDIKDETHALAAKFCASPEAASLPEDNDIWTKAINDYVYAHCSDRTKAFLDDVKVIRAGAKKRGIMV